EKEVALSVSKGLTNREIASQLNVSERTVKSHLGNIFKKLELKDRVALILYLT
ncbi:MAG: response regulator transcription factor, partial [Gammaproteobacteria bacterium]|nr:response regulator transcription factor [Gammaproteobacteria bacterium]